MLISSLKLEQSFRKSDTMLLEWTCVLSAAIVGSGVAVSMKWAHREVHLLADWGLFALLYWLSLLDGHFVNSKLGQYSKAVFTSIIP